MIEVGATVRNFSEAMKSLDALILSEELITMVIPCSI